MVEIEYLHKHILLILNHYFKYNSLKIHVFNQKPLSLVVMLICQLIAVSILVTIITCFSIYRNTQVKWRIHLSEWSILAYVFHVLKTTKRFSIQLNRYFKIHPFFLGTRLSNLCRLFISVFFSSVIWSTIILWLVYRTWW